MSTLPFREPAVEAAVGSTGKNLKTVAWRAWRKDANRSSKAGSKFCSRLSRKTEWPANPDSRLWKSRALCPAEHLMTPTARNDYFRARGYKYGW
ncbi:hypothetical protein SLEP1_g56663 [Rubroshorea leprosula]|uniref:Uncharacterized protein n=1 Tax=Rubroshorea leprosula TaxID=152421 RepID=A0AAV5MMW5_9ROSI|nr:hypothetical protein SLEP1_g56663 [Rubroshorea leprosula]